VFRELEADYRHSQPVAQRKTCHGYKTMGLPGILLHVKQIVGNRSLNRTNHGKSLSCLAIILIIGADRQAQSHG